VEISARSRKAALLCAIAGVHVVLLWSIDLGTPGVRMVEKAATVLFFIEIPEPDAATASAPDMPQPRISFVEPHIESESDPEVITLLPESDESSVDWNAESRRIAGEVVARRNAEEKFRSLDRPPAGMGPPPPKASRHQAGDTERFEGGEILTWVNDRCYYTNQNYRSPYWAGYGFGSGVQLQRPVCKGGPPAEPQITFEEWRKKKGEPPADSAGRPLLEQR
jgi:hypothetical protein